MDLGVPLSFRVRNTFFLAYASDFDVCDEVLSPLAGWRQAGHENIGGAHAGKTEERMARLWPKGLVGRSMVVVGAILLLQLAVSLSFYASIDRAALNEDHARRVAELLVVGRRVHAVDGDGGPDAGRIMTTSYLSVAVVERPPPPPARPDPQAAHIRDDILRWEPGLASANLMLWRQRNMTGGQDLVGAMRLDDGRWLSFRSRDFARAWPMALRVTLMTVLFAGFGLAFALFVMRQMGRPLRTLTEAAHAFGHGPHAPVTVEGSADLKEVGRAFNEMQDRISALMADQARSMEAISHDLRTPLSRLRLASQFVEPADMRDLVADNVDELDGMLNSLGAYLRAQHETSVAEETDIAALAAASVDGLSPKARYSGPASLVAVTHRRPLEEALRRLVDNAVRFGGGAEVILDESGPAPTILVRDHGPGMSAEDLAQIYQPFFRADAARARDTGGFGLGVPTAARLLTRFGGGIDIANAPDGGLLVTVTPPPAGL